MKKYLLNGVVCKNLSGLERRVFVCIFMKRNHLFVKLSVRGGKNVKMAEFAVDRVKSKFERRSEIKLCRARYIRCSCRCLHVTLLLNGAKQ